MSQPAPADAASVLSMLGDAPCAATLAGAPVASERSHLALQSRIAEAQAAFVDGELDAAGLNAAVLDAILGAPTTAHLVLSMGFDGWPPEGPTFVLRRMLGGEGGQGAYDALAELAQALERAGGPPVLPPDQQATYEAMLGTLMPGDAYARQVAALVDVYGGACATPLEQYYLGQLVASSTARALGHGPAGRLAGTAPPPSRERAEAALPILETLGPQRVVSALAFLMDYTLEDWIGDVPPAFLVPRTLGGRIPLLQAAAARIADDMGREMPLREADML